MISEAAVWLIWWLPLTSFLIIVFVVRPFFNRHSIFAGYLTILSVAGSLVLSIWALASVIDDGEQLVWPAHSWLAVGNLDLDFGILLDPLTAIMLVVASGISLVIQVYSLGYMKDDSGYARYFAFMSLFTASMLGLVMASNIIQLFVFWELVGLCSYLLIGFWFNRPAAAAAAKKAFIVTRVGDFGFLLAIMYLFFNAGSFAAQEPSLSPLVISDINAAAAGGVIASGVATWVAVGIFAGAVGKSGQFPLHTWLPDAMEGPTPVSALIHAATMVAAGVFLVARFFPLFESSATAMNSVAIIGGFTAIFAASMGLVMNDIKRVLAYSTISQLGYMMLALGVGAYSAAIFHLFTHAFFKALLVSRFRQRQPCHRDLRHALHGGPAQGHALDLCHVPDRESEPVGHFPAGRFLEQGRDSRSRVGSRRCQSACWYFGSLLIAVFMTAFYMFRALFHDVRG